MLMSFHQVHSVPACFTWRWFHLWFISLLDRTKLTCRCILNSLSIVHVLFLYNGRNMRNFVILLSAFLVCVLAAGRESNEIIPDFKDADTEVSIILPVLVVLFICHLSQTFLRYFSGTFKVGTTTGDGRGLSLLFKWFWWGRFTQ